MGKRRVVSIAGMVVAMVLLAAQPATAATEVGNPCTGNASTPNATFISEANAPGSPFPATVPSAGVITHWTFTVATIPPNVLTQTLKVFRPTGTPKQFQVVGESTPGLMVTGTNEFDTRIPVQAGDYLGYSGFAEGGVLTVYCNTGNPADRAGMVGGNPTNGSTATVTAELSTIQIPLVAKIEPDADGDGYGDETQDKCPQSAAVQSECPLAVIDSYPLSKKGKVVVFVVSSTTAAVTVTGRAKLPKPKKTARSSAQARLPKVTKQVTPGKIVRFVLKFPRSLKRAIRGLPRSKAIVLKLQATTTNLAGQISSDRAKLKLRR